MPVRKQSTEGEVIYDLVHEWTDSGKKDKLRDSVHKWIDSKSHRQEGLEKQ